MPLQKQVEAIFNGRILGHWWQQNGIEVIPNIRFNGSRTYEYAFEGIFPNSNVAIGSLGCIKKLEEHKFFEEGLAKMIHILKPKNLIVYGALPQAVCQTNLSHSMKGV